MFRSALTRLSSAAISATRSNIHRTPVVAIVRHSSHGPVESDEQFDARYETFFDDPNTDGWMIRKGINDLQGMDMVPEPKIIISVMKACRRIDDYSLAVRYLEAVQDKCGNKVKTIWPFIEQEIRPALDELGILTPEQMGYDKPELACENVYDMH